MQNATPTNTTSKYFNFCANTKIAELCHEIEDRDEALSRAREAAHKAQLQKFQVNV